MKPPTQSPARLLPALLLLIAAWVLWSFGLFGTWTDPTVPNTQDPETPAATDLAPAAPSPNPDTSPQTTGDVLPVRQEAVSTTSPGGTLTVVDPAGDPVPGLRLGWVALDEESFYRAFDLLSPPGVQVLGTTDSRGRVSLPKPDALSLGFVVLEEDWLAIGKTVLETPLPEDYRLMVMRGGTLTGRVADAQGPVEGAAIGAMVTTDFLFGAHPDERIRDLFFTPANHRYGTTDASGRFRIGGLIPSSDRLDLIAAGCVPERHDYEGPLPGEVLDIGTIHLTAGVEATFEVRSSVALEEGTRLYLASEEKYTCRAVAGLPLDGEGRLTLEGMRPGAYEWMVERPDAVAIGGELVVPEEGGLVPIALPGLRELVVEAVDSHGSAIPDFVLTARESQGKPRVFESGGKGEVLIRRGAESRLRLSVKAEGFAPPKGVQVAPGQARVTLRMHRYGALDLLVTGVEDGSILRIELLPSADPLRKQLAQGSFPGARGEEHVVVDGRVHLGDLAPGGYSVLVGHGGGLKSYGAVTIEPEILTEHVLDLQELETIQVEVVASESGAPLPGVQVSLMQEEDPRFGMTIMDSLGFDLEVDQTTDPQGRFQFQAFPGQARYLHLQHPERLAITEAYPGDDHRPVRIAMEKRPETPIQVEIVPGRPAAFAEISFARHDGWPALPTPLGYVSLNEEGVGRLDRSPGKALLQANFDWSPAVRYSMPYGEVNVVDGQELRLTLLEDGGRLALTPPPMGGPRSLTIRPVRGVGFAPLRVQCKVGAWSEILPLPPGEYRVEASSGTREIYATFRIHADETTTLDWNTEVQSFRVDLLGKDWTRAQLRAQVADGPQEGAFRDIQLDATDPSWLVEGFPAGKVEVKLVEWWDQEGNGHRMSWTKELPPGEPVLRFSLEDFAMVTVQVLDPQGKPVPQALVQLRFGNTGADGELSGLTDSEGHVHLLARRGALIMHAYKDGYRLATRRMTLRADETWTVQMRK